jgi:hypothetical protein
VRYRFKGIVRTTGQTVEGHAHGDTADVALQALSDHGIVTESLREDPEPLNMAQASQPLSSAIDSALDTAASQVPFDKVAERYKGKNVWVLDRDKIRNRVAQVVDQAISQATNGMSMVGGGVNVNDLRAQVNEAIGGLFKDNRNLTEPGLRHLDEDGASAPPTRDHGPAAGKPAGADDDRDRSHRQRGGGGGGGGWGPRRFAGQSAGGGGEQNAVLLEIFKENLKLRGIEIDEPATAAANAGGGGGGGGGGTATATVPPPPIASASDRPQRPAIRPVRATCGGGNNENGN